MANPAVTYTFANSTTADATQVNQNFTDLINSLTDGTKSLSIDALTVGGTATLNGAVALGNGSPDDITVSGSLASSIPIKTNNSYDIGAATLALAGVYLGAPSSRSTRVTSNQAIGASYTLVLPPSAGTAGQGLVSTGSGTLFATSQGQIANLGIAAAVATSALTVALKGADGNDPSSTNPVYIAFRSTTATTGTPTLRAVTAATSVVVSSGSTLGSTDGDANWVYVYAVDNDGTVELAVSASKMWDEGSLYTTTSEGGNADSKVLLYSTSARTSKPIRLLGRVKSTQATAGTWATSPSEVSLVPFEQRAPRSEVWVYNGTNGYGSTNTKIRRFDTTGKNVGTAITYADSGTDGGSFTINEDGLYAITYTEGLNGNANFGVSVNSTQLTDSITDIAAADRRFLAQQSGATSTPPAVGSLILYAGDIVRAHTDGGTDGAVPYGACSFRIVKVTD